MRRKSAVSPELDYLLDAGCAIDGQRGEDGEVNNQNRPIQHVELVERADIPVGLVDRLTKLGKVSAKIARQALQVGGNYRKKHHSALRASCLGPTLRILTEGGAGSNIGRAVREGRRART